jgi:hypothetical protein
VPVEYRRANHNRAHVKGWKPLPVTVSFVGTEAFIHESGADAEKVAITQVVSPDYLTPEDRGALSPFVAKVPPR